MSGGLDLERLKELLAQARALPAAQRDPFLVASASDSPELLAELRSLLGVGETPGIDPLRLPAEDDDRRQAFPKRIGPFDIEGVLGRGGMGIVYRANNPQAGVSVALKVLQPGMGTQEFLKRFEAERKVMARFQHRNIAQIYDAGVDPSGPPYLAMQLVDGPNLLDHCNAQRASLIERLQLFRQVCLGVHHAHLRGVLHRDLKPSNILVANEDGVAVPKIIDFGIAKAIRRGQSGPDAMTSPATALTMQGQMVGTLEYMSPEQADAATKDIDTRSDVYSLGVMLYELLTDKLPFAATRYRSGSYSEMLRMLREESPVPPSERVAEDGGRDPVPTDLNCVILKCLQGDRRLRYTSAKELADDLERFLTGHPVAAKPPSRKYLMGKFVRRHRLGVAALAGVFLTLVLGLVGTSYGFYREYQREQELIRTVAGLEEALEDSEALSVYMYRMMKLSDPEQLGSDATIRQGIYAMLEHARSDDRSADFVRGRVLIHAGRVLADIDDDDAAMQSLAEGVELVGMPNTERGRFMLSLALYDMAYMHYEQRRLDESEQAFRDAREALRGLEDSQLLMILGIDSSLAGLIEERGDYTRSLILKQEIIARAEQAELGPQHLSSHRMGLGVAQFRVGRRETGLETMRQAYAQSQIGRGPSEAIPLSLQRSLGLMLLVDFRFDEAAQVFEDYTRNIAAGPGPDTFDGHSARAYALLAQTHLDAGESAAEALAEQIEILERRFPQRFRDSYLPQHLIATELIQGKEGAEERAGELVAALDAREDLAGPAANVCQLFARARLRHSDGNDGIAAAYLSEALERHRALMESEAPLFDELERLIEQARHPQIAAN